MGDTEKLRVVLWGLWRLYKARAACQTAHDFGEQLLHLAQRQDDAATFLGAYCALGGTALFRGELHQAQAHASQGMRLYDPRHHSSLAVLYGEDPGVGCHAYSALTLWLLGYPDQALTTMQAALTLQQHGKRAEAHELLAPVYGWFTEGFDTADLQDTQALLNDLSGVAL